MYRSVSTSRVSENYYNNNSTSAVSSPKVSPSVRALSLETNEIPLYEQTVLLSSEISKKERNTRPKFAENAVHFIPFVLLSCVFILWFFSNPGPKEFTAVFYSLQSWRSNFEKFDRDRSGKIDSSELRDALASLGFSVSPVVLDLLVSKFDKSGGHNKAIEYDNFIECCLTVKGLTEKFKEKDTAYSGNATFTYESFMLTVLPFLIA